MLCDLDRFSQIRSHIEYQNLKVDFHCYTRRRYGCLATGSVENYFFQCYMVKPMRWLYIKMARETRQNINIYKWTIFCLHFFRTVLTGKQMIATPLNKDHHSTYHQGEVSIPYIEAIFKGSSPFYRKLLKKRQKLNILIIKLAKWTSFHLKRDLQLVIYYLSFDS